MSRTNGAEIKADVRGVAFCGLYCYACRAYLRGRCAGCRDRTGADWCGIRKCCLRQGRTTCAECGEHQNVGECGLFMNWVSRIFGWVFRSDRAGCIRQIREKGLEEHARWMAAEGKQTLRRGEQREI